MKPTKGGKKKHYDNDENDEEVEPSCRHGVFTAVHLWDGKIVEPDGATYYMDQMEYPSTAMGVQFPFVGTVYDAPGGRDIGTNAELCTRLNDAHVWHCQGTYVNLYGCVGSLAFAGIFDDSTDSGHLVVTGGTGDFLGAMGSMEDTFDPYTGFTSRVISLV